MSSNRKKFIPENAIRFIACGYDRSLEFDDVGHELPLEKYFSN